MSPQVLSLEARVLTDTRVESARELEEGCVRWEEKHETVCCPPNGTCHSWRPLPSGVLTSHTVTG